MKKLAMICGVLFLIQMGLATHDFESRLRPMPDGIKEPVEFKIRLAQLETWQAVNRVVGSLTGFGLCGAFVVFRKFRELDWTLAEARRQETPSES